MMRNTNKIFLFLLALLPIIALLTYHNHQKKNPTSIRDGVVSIRLEDDSKLLFLRAKGWGIVGNHEEIVLSQSENGLPNKTVDYIFYTSEVFYKIEDGNKIILFAPESSITEPINKIPNVVIKSMRTADEISNYSINYQKYGLQRISVYKH